MAEALEKAKCRREIDLAKRHALRCVGSHARNSFIGRSHDALCLRSSRDRSRGADETFPETLPQVLTGPVPAAVAIPRLFFTDARCGIAAISASPSRTRPELG